MPRARAALALSGLLAVVTFAFGIDLFLDRACDSGGDCNSNLVAWGIGAPLTVCGAGALMFTAVGWRHDPRGAARLACTLWAALMLVVTVVTGAYGALTSILLVLSAIALTGLGAWVGSGRSRG